MDREIDRQIENQMDEWMDGWVDGWVGGSMDGCWECDFRIPGAISYRLLLLSSLYASPGAILAPAPFWVTMTALIVTSCRSRRTGSNPRLES